jgi:hypothetical protein
MLAGAAITSLLFHIYFSIVMLIIRLIDWVHMKRGKPRKSRSSAAYRRSSVPQRRGSMPQRRGSAPTLISNSSDGGGGGTSTCFMALRGLAGAGLHSRNVMLPLGD